MHYYACWMLLLPIQSRIPLLKFAPSLSAIALISYHSAPFEHMLTESDAYYLVVL